MFVTMVLNYYRKYKYICPGEMVNLHNTTNIILTFGDNCLGGHQDGSENWDLRREINIFGMLEPKPKKSTVGIAVRVTLPKINIGLKNYTNILYKGVSV